MELSKTFDQVFLIVDALDECQPRQNVPSLTTRLSRDISYNFKVFLTGRREIDIEIEFTRENSHTLQIEAKKVNEDIKTFVPLRFVSKKVLNTDIKVPTGGLSAW